MPLIVQLVPVLAALVKAIEETENPIDSKAFARAKQLLTDKGEIEWTELFLEHVARMRVYQRQFFAANYGSQFKAKAQVNAMAAEAYVDQCLHYMGYVPGKSGQLTKTDSLFEVEENPFYPDHEGG